jgi:hypothetical protein
MKKKIIIELSFDTIWDDYEDVYADIILDDAIRELATGVTYEIISKDSNI